MTDPLTQALTAMRDMDRGQLLRSFDMQIEHLEHELWMLKTLRDGFERASPLTTKAEAQEKPAPSTSKSVALVADLKAKLKPSAAAPRPPKHTNGLDLTEKEASFYDLLEANGTVSTMLAADIFGEGQPRHTGVYQLRKKLNAIGKTIEWVKGEGYQLLSTDSV